MTIDEKNPNTFSFHVLNLLQYHVETSKKTLSLKVEGQNGLPKGVRTIEKEKKNYTHFSRIEV